MGSRSRCWSPPLLALLLTAAALGGCGGTGSRPASEPGAARPGEPAEARRDRIPRQRSVERYVAMLEAPSRAEWQRPEELVAALELEPGMRVADVGTGSGYFLPLLDAAVGPEGRVVAEDIDPDLVAVVRERAEREGLDRVQPRLGAPDDPALEEGLYDRVLIVDVFHHVAQPVRFLSHVRRALAPGGRLYLVDFPPGPSVPTEISGTEHRIAREEVLASAREAGLELVEEPELLPYQYVLVFQSAVPNPTRSPQALPSWNEKPKGAIRFSSKPRVRKVASPRASRP